MTEDKLLSRIGHAIVTSPGVACLIDGTLRCVTTLRNWRALIQGTEKFSDFAILAVKEHDVDD
jgi:hypothetical protein